MPKLLLKGNKDGMIISRAQAEAIASDLASNTLQPGYQIGVLTVRSSMINGVIEDEVSREKFDPFTASTQQLKDFVADFAPDFEKWLYARPIEECPIKYYMIFRGAMTEKAGIRQGYPGMLGDDGIRQTLDRNLFFWIDEKYRAWRMLRDRRKYAQKKELEALERTAPDEINVNDFL